MPANKHILFSLLALLLILTFQNCGTKSDVLFTESSNKLASGADTRTDGGDGQPFDGKVYELTGETCPDQSSVRARILLKTFTSALLVRENCQDINPVSLTTAEFQMNASNSEELIYKSQSFVSVKPTQVIGTKIDLSSANPDSGFGLWLKAGFGTAPDVTGFLTISKLRLYEDGVLLGPPHSSHSDIRTLGQGRYSHWDDSGGQDPAGGESLRFSASDNSDPRTNGRVYSYKILD